MDGCVVTVIPADKKATKNLVINAQKSIRKCYLVNPLKHILVADILEIFNQDGLPDHMELLLSCALLRATVQRIPLNLISSPSF